MTGFDREQAEWYLKRVFNGSRGWFGLSWSMTGDDFHSGSYQTAVEVVDQAEALDDLGAHSIWVRMTKMPRSAGSRKGGAKQTHAVPGMWADVDYGTMGHKHDPSKHDGLVLPAGPDEAMALIRASGLPEPTMIVDSGGGLYPLWLFDTPWVMRAIEDVEAATEMGRQWEAQLAAGAETLGLYYGTGMSNLDRVLRLPGGVNRKAGSERPCRVVVEGGATWPLGGLQGALDDAGMLVERKVQRPAGGGGDALDDEQRAQLDFDDATDPGPMSLLAQSVGIAGVLYAAGWTDCGCGRRPETIACFSRPGGGSVTSHSAHILAVQPNVLVVHSAEAGVPAGAGQRLTAGRLFAHLHHGDDMSAAAMDIMDARRGGGTVAGRALIGAGLPPLEGREDQVEDAATLPRVDVGNDDEAARWLQREVGRVGSPLAGMFIKGGLLVHTPLVGESGYRVLGDEADWDDGPAQVQPVRVDGLVAKVTYAYSTFMRGGRGTEQPRMIGRGACAAPVNAPRELTNVRTLRTVTHTPMMLRDGTVLDEPGWRGGVLFLPAKGLHIPRVSDEPSAAEVQWAAGLLLAMVQDFPWNSEHDRANYLSLLLLPLMRELVPPPYKMTIINAHQRGSGKSLLAWIARELHGGVFRGDVPPDGEEFRKQVTTILTQTTGPVVQWDNVRKIGSRNFDALLSSATWSDRALGSNTMAFGVNDRLWVATGNNVTLAGDLGRRTRWATIDPDTPNPEKRTDFAIVNLKSWVADGRGQLLKALLTLVRTWVVAGQPTGGSLGEDDYARSTEAVRGVLGNAGIEGLVDHPSTVRQEENEEDEELGHLLAYIHEYLGTKAWTVSEVAGHLMMMEDAPDDLKPESTRAVGNWLKAREGRWAGGFSLKKTGTKVNNVVQWRVTRA